VLAEQQALDESTFRRDADRSRLAILDAAEALFADHGFEAVSMERIGRAANLSRGAPGYFFGSKDALYRAVMERLFETTEQLVERTHRELADVPGHDLDRTLEIVVDNLMEFLYERPTFVTLVEREALRRSGVMQGNRVHLTLLRMALTLTDRMDWTSAASNPQQLLLTLLSLCWFPLANPPLIRDLGGQLDRTFVEARKRHVVALLRTGLIGGRRR
jgi:AcrR family transcriptional regulator